MKRAPAPQTLYRCPKCKGFKPYPDAYGPHAPHFKGDVLVDCAGDPINPKSSEALGCAGKTSGT